MNFGAHIGQGSLPNVVTAALLLLLLLFTPVPLRVLQSRLDDEKAKDASATSIAPTVPVPAPATASSDAQTDSAAHQQAVPV